MYVTILTGICLNKSDHYSFDINFRSFIYWLGRPISVRITNVLVIGYNVVFSLNNSKWAIHGMLVILYVWQNSSFVTTLVVLLKAHVVKLKRLYTINVSQATHYSTNKMENFIFRLFPLFCIKSGCCLQGMDLLVVFLWFCCHG